MASIFSAFANAFQSVGVGIPFQKQAADLVRIIGEYID